MEEEHVVDQFDDAFGVFGGFGGVDKNGDDGPAVFVRDIKDNGDGPLRLDSKKREGYPFSGGTWHGEAREKG